MSLSRRVPTEVIGTAYKRVQGVAAEIHVIRVMFSIIHSRDKYGCFNLYGTPFIVSRKYFIQLILFVWWDDHSYDFITAILHYENECDNSRAGLALQHKQLH